MESVHTIRLAQFEPPTQTTLHLAPCYCFSFWFESVAMHCSAAISAPGYTIRLHAGCMIRLHAVQFKFWFTGLYLIVLFLIR